MGIDRLDDADVSADEPSDRPADCSESAGNSELADRADIVRMETRYRQDYYEDLRAAVAQEARTEPRRTADPEGRTQLHQQVADGKPWEEVTGWSKRVWAEYQCKWPPDERAPADRAVNQELDQECGQIAKRERERISPAMLEIESRDPDRHLVGFKYRLKGRDRIEEKVAAVNKALDHSVKEAVSLIPDAIRYTFQYEEARYSQGVRADIGHLKEHGFKMLTLKNSWSDEQYKGINSQWIDPDSGQRFELQFHTRISFEAKQITHPAYERLRSQPKPDELETLVLRAFQREVSAAIAVPPSAKDIPDYPEKGRNAR